MTKDFQRVLVSLSIAGMGIMSSRRIERNTPIAVRFALDGSGGERVEAEGRIVERPLAAWRAIEGLDLESKDDPPVVSGTFRPR